MEWTDIEKDLAWMAVRIQNHAANRYPSSSARYTPASRVTASQPSSMLKGRSSSDGRESVNCIIES